MKKILAVAAALLFPFYAHAVAATWSDTDTGVKAVCASGTCDAPVAAASLTDGLDLTTTRAKGILVTVCADSGQTLSGAGTLTAYNRDPAVALWAVLPDMNLSPATATVRCISFAGLYVPVSKGRVLWVPTGVTVSAGGVTVFITGA
jgi:hypothetical protein